MANLAPHPQGRHDYRRSCRSAISGASPSRAPAKPVGSVHLASPPSGLRCRGCRCGRRGGFVRQHNLNPPPASRAGPRRHAVGRIAHQDDIPGPPGAVPAPERAQEVAQTHRGFLFSQDADRQVRRSAAAQLPPNREGHARGGGRRGWRCLHHHETRPLQVLHQPVRRDPRHHVVGMVDPLPPLIAKREGEGLGDFVRCGWAEVGCFGHGGTMRDSGERSKNIVGARCSMCMPECMPCLP